MTVSEVRKRYLDFFAKRRHAIIPSAPIVPENDPTTLFTSSGMQPLVPYLMGAEHPEGTRLADSQMSLRAEDIEEVGDNRHTTFFEMLGNWSLGDYFKEKQLPWIFEFLTNKEEGLGLDPHKLYVTVFGGDEESGMAKDEESVAIWQKLFSQKNIDAKFVELGTEERGNEVGMQGGRIFSYGAKKNWWSRAGVPTKMPAGEIGGPDSEVFYDFGLPHDPKFGRECHPNCDCGRFIEIGNSVFMQFIKNSDGTFSELPKRNVDFGGGLERLTAATCDDADIFNIGIFAEAKSEIARLSGVSYSDIGGPQGNPSGIVVVGKEKKVGMPAEKMQFFYRVIMDHIRAATFLIAAGKLPGKSEQGYVIRRLLRRAVRFANNLLIPPGNLSRIADVFINEYQDVYSHLSQQREFIINAIKKEEADFRGVLSREGPKLDIQIQEAVFNGGVLSPDIVFLFVTSHGYPLEMVEEEARERGVRIDKDAVAALLEEHQARSRAGAAQKFAGGLADQSEQTVRYHTAHHLLLKALQQALGPEVHQRGSNITAERLRIDFNYGAKMTDEQKAAVEKIVNEKIAEGLPVIRTVMNKADAEKLNAEHEFGANYPEQVSVYSIGPKDATQDDPKFAEAFSIEFCGGPHVANTSTLGHFKISKEEASSAGIRRIKAILE